MALDIGIDLGTANIIITIAGKGMNRPWWLTIRRKKQSSRSARRPTR